MSSPLISIAMTTYNGEKYLKKQLDSLCNQTYPNIEVVVCDDRSKDNTESILKSYQKRLKLQYFVNEQNLGVVKNFEKALSLCHGAYIALCDQDDIWLPNKIETLVRNIGTYSLIFSDAALIDINDKIIEPSFRKFQKLVIWTERPLLPLFFGNFVTGCTAMLTKELVDKALPIPGGERFHDWWLATVATKLHGIKALDNKLVLYRQHGTNDIGAIVAYNLYDRIKGLIKNPLNTIRSIQLYEKNYSKVQVKRIKSIIKNPLFSSRERIVLKEVFLYHIDVFQTKIHLKRFKLAYKYRNILFCNRKGISFYLAIFIRLIV